MKLEVGILSIAAVTFLLFLLTIKTYDNEDGRVVHEEWLLKNHLLLPSEWRLVTPPTPNSATNAADLNEKNFATTKNGGFQSKMNQLLLSSLQTWRPVSPPGSNPGQNSVSPVAKKNFAGSKLKKQHVLLPSLQKGPAIPPGPNPGHNFVTPIGQKNFAGLELKKQHVLLPSLQKGSATSPGPNPGTNPKTPIGQKNIAGLKMRKNSGCNMGTKKNFAVRKMATAHPPPLPLVVASLKATS